MARRRAYVHIGLAGTGGAFLGAALANHADALRGQRVSVPARSTDEMFHAALEMRRDHASWGLRRRDVEGAWARVCRRALKDKGTVVVGHELLAACSPEQIELLLDGLAGLEVHLVVTARDPATQAVACWTDTLEYGSATPFDGFRAAQALDEVLERWTAAIGDPGRVHVVVPPADDADPRPAIWRAVGRLAGFDAKALPLAVAPSSSPDGTGPALLRGVDAALDGRLGSGGHRRVVHELLATSGVTGVGERPAVPPSGTTTCSRSRSGGPSSSRTRATTCSATRPTCCPGRPHRRGSPRQNRPPKPCWPGPPTSSRTSWSRWCACASTRRRSRDATRG